MLKAHIPEIETSSAWEPDEQTPEEEALEREQTGILPAIENITQSTSLMCVGDCTLATTCRERYKPHEKPESHIVDNINTYNAVYVNYIL